MGYCLSGRWENYSRFRDVSEKVIFSQIVEVPSNLSEQPDEEFGFVGFLPIVFWMVPLGFIILAQDSKWLQRPTLKPSLGANPIG